MWIRYAQKAESVIIHIDIIRTTNILCKKCGHDIFPCSLLHSKWHVVYTCPKTDVWLTTQTRESSKSSYSSIFLRLSTTVDNHNPQNHHTRQFTIIYNGSQLLLILTLVCGIYDMAVCMSTNTAEKGRHSSGSHYPYFCSFLLLL